jgi:quinoprotein glucose dehydrogenase
MARTIETDVAILGAGISAAMVAEKLSDETESHVTVVEAGNKVFNLSERFDRRHRFLSYGENPWPDDHVPGLRARGIYSRSMVVGGMALHWGGTSPRYSPEDFRLRTLYGVGRDWPVTYDELEPYYVEAEERIGVAGTPGPPELDPRSKPYPMPPLPLSYNLTLLKEWAEKSGIPFWPNPVAKNSVPYHGRNVCTRCDTCSICPTGAKYSPDFTFEKLLERGRFDLLDRTYVKKLELASGSSRVERALAANRDRPDEEIEIRAGLFVVACGYVWSSHLLLVSGLANRSGLVGKYMTGHRPVEARVAVPMKLFPGIYEADSLLSKKYERPGKLDRYVRHDLRVWESSFGREPRLENDSGEPLLGDAVLADWRERTKLGAARLRAYYDVLPARESAVTLEPEKKSPFGDPLPRVQFVDSEESVRLREHTEAHVHSVFDEIVRAGGGTILDRTTLRHYDHPGGGCSMGSDPETSVVDGYGRTHDHENLFVVGAPTIVTGGCNNGTLSFAALSLRSASEMAKELPGKKPPSGERTGA